MIRLTQMLALPLAAGLLLAGCSKEPADDKEAGRTASGEVLQGSISDAMIPYDQLRSQPPIEQPAPEPASGPDAGTSRADAPPTDPITNVPVIPEPDASSQSDGN